MKQMHSVALKMLDRIGFGENWGTIVLGAAIGTVTALGAIAFKGAIDGAYESGITFHTKLPLYLLPLFPILGALATALLVHFFAPEARGHGVPEVMHAVMRKNGVIKPRGTLVKSLASITTIGSGGSAGAEGPIVQIGSALGSGIAQMLRISKDQVPTLLGCGAAAGIASVFNAPIAGVFFVIEILLKDLSGKTIAPVLVASVFSAATTQAILGQNEAIFAVSEELRSYQFTASELPSYILLGVVCGFIAAGFIKLLYTTEDVFEKVKIHPIIKPVVGAVLLGAAGVVYLQLTTPAVAGEQVPPFFGNGYETIETLLEPGHYTGAAVPEASGHVTIPSEFLLLGILVLMKAGATVATLGSGGSGGVFAPSLFLGATAGAAIGIALEHAGLIPQGGSPAAYALVGMAAVVAATTHAALTAILMLFELTSDYKVILPIMLAAVVSTAIAQLVHRESIYTLKLRRKGVLTGSAADHTILRRISVRDVPPVPHVAVRPADPLSRLLELRDVYRVLDFVVVDSTNHYVGLVTAQDLRTALIEREAIPYLLVAELVREDIPTVLPDEPLDAAFRKFSDFDVSSLPIVTYTSDSDEPPVVQGLLTRARLMQRYHDDLKATP